MSIPLNGPFYHAIRTIPLMRVAYRIGLFIRNYMAEDEPILVGGLLKKQEQMFDDFTFTDPYHAIMLLFMLNRYDYLEHINRDQGYLVTQRLLDDFPLLDEIFDDHDEYINLLHSIGMEDRKVEIIFRHGTWLDHQEFTALDLGDLLIDKLECDVFNAFPRLQHIKLNHNLLGTLPETIFRSLDDLQSLNLSNNIITSLPLHIFSNNLKLAKLNLAHNGIDHQWLQKFNVLNRLTHHHLEIKI